jgi:cell division protein FtsN
MDDIQVLLYIVIGLFYFIAKFMKKKPVPQKPVQKPATGSADTNAPQKPLTFEELLKEFTQPQQQEKEEEIEEDEEVFIDTRDEGRKNAEPAYKPDYTFSDAETKRNFEQSQRLVAAAKRIDEEGIEIESTFKPHRMPSRNESKNEVAAEIMEMLQDADGAKKAVILSEIFNRKY